MLFSTSGFTPEAGEILADEQVAINAMLATFNAMPDDVRERFMRTALPLLITLMTAMNGPHEAIAMLWTGIDGIAEAHNIRGIVIDDGDEDAVDMLFPTETRH